jgi:DNA topoisomerase III
VAIAAASMLLCMPAALWTLETCVIVLQGKTSAPEYLSESELIGKMEQHSIGTDASIAVHINNVCERNDVKVESGRRLVPTELGITLISGYQRIDPELCRPQVSSCCATDCNMVPHEKQES